MTGTLKKRSDKVAFLEVDGTFTRMEGFTTFSQSKNPTEYSRRYVDQDFENTDVTGYSPQIGFGVDQYEGNAVHDHIVDILDNEKLGNDAIVTICVVDVTDNSAVKRTWTVVGDTEGDSMDAYTYSGNFRVKGEKVFGTASSDDNWATCTFSPTASL